MRIKPLLILPLVLGALLLYGLVVFVLELSGAGSNNGFIRLSGRIEGVEYHVAAKTAGRITDFKIEEGQLVSAGDEIALIDAPQLNALIEQAKAGWRKTRLYLKLAEKEYQRASQLAKENIISKQAYEAAESVYLVAKEECLAAENELQKLTADLADTRIVAPVSGTVVTKIVQLGEMVPPGVPLVTIINMDDLFLKAFLPTETVGKVSLNDEAKIYPDAYPSESFDAFVNKISEKAEFIPKNVETKSQRANMVFEIKLKIKQNKDYRLKPGMPADALIRADKNAAWEVNN